MCLWKGWVYCICWMECFIDSSYVKFVVIVEVFYILAAFLSTFISYWKWVLKSLTIIAELFLSPSVWSVSALCTWGCTVRCVNVCNCYAFLMNWPFPHDETFPFSLIIAFVLKSILSEINVVTPALVWLLFAWYIFFCPSTFSLFVSLNQRFVPCKQYIVTWILLFWISDFLVGVFRSSIFNGMIDMVGFMFAILLFIFYIFSVFFVPLFVLDCLLFVKYSLRWL